MKRSGTYLMIFLLLLIKSTAAKNLSFNFCGDQVTFQYDESCFIDFNMPLSPENVQDFFAAMNQGCHQPVIDALVRYKTENMPDDWLFYQLIRKTAETLSPKKDNYNRYTLYKWYFLCKTGYDATVSVSKEKILFYVWCNEPVYDIPTHIENGRRYVCLNFHDYKQNEFAEEETFTTVRHVAPDLLHSFSYKISRLPNFTEEDYQEKKLTFKYDHSDYHFYVKVNTKVKKMFINYPVTEFESYINMPLSAGTYKSLMPVLKKHVKNMSQKKGIDYLMCFTRYAFLYETDHKNFGKEKRLSPEETLLYDYSDCEDRTALFYYLVKEIYNLPMIVLSFPDHVTIAVKFEQPFGKSIEYNGSYYTVCEPTPQKIDLYLGELPPELKKASYEIKYAYEPK